MTRLRLGGPVPWTEDPSEWIASLRQRGYRAAYCPVALDAPDARIAEFRQAAEENDIVISEVGAWSNPLSPDPAEAAASLQKCKDALRLADKIGAHGAVNIAGSCGPRWDGPYPENLSPATFERIVAQVKEILEEVRPERACYTLETMPWIWPHSAEAYEKILRAVDHPRFAVHLDPVNLVNSVEKAFGNGELIRDCFRRLGPWLQGIHAKDIVLGPELTVHLREVRPGLGILEYPVLLTEVANLNPDIPIMLEHLPSEDEYVLAAAYVRQVGAELGFDLGTPA